MKKTFTEFTKSRSHSCFTLQFAFAVPCFSSQRLGTSRWRRFSVATGSCHCSCMMVVLKRILWPSQRDLMTLMTLSTSRPSHVGPLPKLRDAEDLEEKIRNQIICHQMSSNSSIFIMSISLFLSIEKFHLLLLRVFFCVYASLPDSSFASTQLNNSTTRQLDSFDASGNFRLESRPGGKHPMRIATPR